MIDHAPPMLAFGVTILSSMAGVFIVDQVQTLVRRRRGRGVRIEDRP